MSLVLLAISLSIALGVLAFLFAVFALPVMAGIAAFLLTCSLLSPRFSVRSVQGLVLS